MARRRSWTDDDLRRALDGATTLAEVVRRLRLSHGGAAYITVRTRMEQLGLTLGSGRPEPAPEPACERNARASGRRWSDDDLRGAVAATSSLNGVFAHLGLSVGGSQWQVIRARIRELGCDTGHWGLPLAPQPARTFHGAVNVLRHADLDDLLQCCTSRAEILRKVGLQPGATTYRALRSVLDEHGATGQEPALRQGRSAQPRRPLDEILVEDSTWTATARLRERLISAGLKEARCESCGIVTWEGQPAPLQLDHVDGDRRNNRPENLRILCANCHALTPTWCGRNRGNRGSSDQDVGPKR